jgi:hypothetical protein
MTQPVSGACAKHVNTHSQSVRIGGCRQRDGNLSPSAILRSHPHVSYDCDWIGHAQHTHTVYTRMIMYWTLSFCVNSSGKSCVVRVATSQVSQQCQYLLCTVRTRVNARVCAHCEYQFRNTMNCIRKCVMCPLSSTRYRYALTCLCVNWHEMYL